jgi:hypothetical protein
MRLNGQRVWMAGIANVATLPDYRGRGFASHLMHEAHEVIDSEEFLFGLLFTGIHDFYARLGWETLALCRCPSPLRSRCPLPDEWRFRAAEPADLPQVQRWHEHAYAHHPFTVIRDEAYWRVWLRWDDESWRRSFYIAECAGEPLGYLAIETHYRRADDGTRQVEAISLTEIGMDSWEREIVAAYGELCEQHGTASGCRVDSMVHIAARSRTLSEAFAALPAFCRPAASDGAGGATRTAVGSL